MGDTTEHVLSTLRARVARLTAERAVLYRRICGLRDEVRDVRDGYAMDMDSMGLPSGCEKVVIPWSGYVDYPTSDDRYGEAVAPPAAERAPGVPPVYTLHFSNGDDVVMAMAETLITAKAGRPSAPADAAMRVHVFHVVMATEIEDVWREKDVDPELPVSVMADGEPHVDLCHGKRARHIEPYPEGGRGCTQEEYEYEHKCEAGSALTGLTKMTVHRMRRSREGRVGARKYYRVSDYVVRWAVEEAVV
jgi:hypothetical protein